jgi:signal transduction histidine kinase
VGTLADVSVEVRAEAAMSEARDAALNSSAMQRNFTASASHELRTPTTSILGFVEEVLEDGDLSEENRGHLLIVLRNAERLSHLIDDLLILGQSEIGPTMMAVRPTDLRLLAQQVISSLSGTAERVGTALELDAADGDGTTALADPLRLEQALTNLIGNALKFTDGDGRVTVGIRGLGERVELTVSDTGTGIHPADVANIFERFYRTKAAIDTAVKGSGLGLAIAKKMIEAQDGTISVRSALGVGSVFTISLPACAHLPDAVPAPA